MIKVSRIEWSDEELDQKIIEYLNKEGLTSPSDTVGPHTILRTIKTPGIRIGIIRINHSLVRLYDEGIVGKTKKMKYYLKKNVTSTKNINK